MPFSGNESTELILVMDEFSLEIFENGNALSSTLYAREDACEICLSVDADSCVYCRERIPGMDI